MNPGVLPSQSQSQAYWRLRRQVFTATGRWSASGVVRDILLTISGGGGTGVTTAGCCAVNFTGGSGGAGIVGVSNPPSSVVVTISSGTASFGSFATATVGGNASISGSGASGSLSLASNATLISSGIAFNGGGVTANTPSQPAFGTGGIGGGATGGPAVVIVEWMELVNP